CADWTTHATVVGVPLAGNDRSCFAGDGSPTPNSFGNLPGALLRGGTFFDRAAAGVFAVRSVFDPPTARSFVGFRWARWWATRRKGSSRGEHDRERSRAHGGVAGSSSATADSMPLPYPMARSSSSAPRRRPSREFLGFRCAR